MPFLTNNNTKIYYEVHGQGEPLVMISGFTSDHTTWLPVLDSLAQDYQVILLDNRGVGQSDAPDYPYSIEMMAEDVLAVLNELGIQQAYVSGASMGGAVTQLLAYRYPERVKKAIVCTSFAKASHGFLIFSKAMMNFFESDQKETLIRLKLPWLFSSAFLSDEDSVDAMVQMRLSAPPQPIQGYQNQLAAIANFNSQPWLKEIKVPTLFIAGDEDILSLPKYIKQMAKQVPGADYVCMENVAHLPYLENPNGYIEIIRKSLNKM